jgi:glutamate racemase
MKRRPYLGIVDWGIGGIGISKLAKSRIGNVPVVYFSDTGVTPYGRMSRPELVSRLDAVVAFFRTQGVTHLLLGCNAASTIIPFLNVDGLQVKGVIESAIRVTERMRPARLALIGGKRTVLSGIYRRAFAERGIGVEQRIAQPLSAFIESGDISSTELREQIKTILSPVRKCSHLLLACTHYPAILPVLKDFVSRQTILIDPAGELIREIAKWKLPIGGTDIFLTSGDPGKMQDAAWNAFGVRINNASRVTF